MSRKEDEKTNPAGPGKDPEPGTHKQQAGDERCRRKGIWGEVNNVRMMKSTRERESGVKSTT